MLYLSIYEGEDPDRTTPILGSTDLAVIRGVLDILARRLGVRGLVVEPMRRNRQISEPCRRGQADDGESEGPGAMRRRDGDK
jgi:hypothetical protein